MVSVYEEYGTFAFYTILTFTLPTTSAVQFPQMNYLFLPKIKISCLPITVRVVRIILWRAFGQLRVWLNAQRTCNRIRVRVKVRTKISARVGVRVSFRVSVGIRLARLTQMRGAFDQSCKKVSYGDGMLEARTIQFMYSIKN